MSKPLAYLRRSVLYVPAANARAMAKSWSLGADVIVFDLEDAVAPVSYTHLTLPTSP
jgi:citrate lyase subunit beta/citryl-CoA lyase